MISIIYDKTIKCPGQRSLYVYFKYNEKIINIIKNCDCALYDKKLRRWEITETDLPYLVDNLVLLDDIEIIDNYKDEIKKEQIIYPQSNFKTKPFDYQLDGIIYGLNHKKWLLLDAPGLGKTLQVIYIAEELYRLGKIKHCLIICGINTLKENWRKEIEKHSTLDCVILGKRINARGKVVYESVAKRLEQLKSNINEFFIITNVETLRNDDIIKQINNKKTNIDMIVVDELHTCNNSQSQQGKNLLKLKNAEYKIGLTGTLITNSPLDSYAPLKWVDINKANLSTFKHYYIKYGGLFGNEILGYKNLDVLKSDIDMVSLRRTKDLLDLPEKTIIHEIIEMEDKQQLFYNNIVSGIVDQLDKITLDQNSVLSLVTRLRQATSCPSILTSEKIESAKIQRLVDLSEQILYNNDKLVVFSVFKEPLNLIKDRLQKYSPLICSGDISDLEIQNNIEQFQTNPNCKILLCTTSKMGTGVTLTSASYMIFLDSPWTSALCEQCEDRIHRIGSKNPVFIYYLWTNNTFDMQVKQIIEDKSLLENYIIDNQIYPDFVERLRKLILDLKIS